MTTNRGRGGLLFPEDVARIWTEERRKVEGPAAPEVLVDRVYDFYKWSKPTPPGKKTRNRYENWPMPYAEATRGKRQPAWYEDQERDLRSWWHERLVRTELANEDRDRRQAVWAEALNLPQS